MEWEFVPEQVVKGEVAYGLKEFRRDLAQEVRVNLGPVADGEFARAYDILYDLCYWLATGKPFDDFLDGFEDDPVAIRLIKAAHDAMSGNVEMLGAILQRQIMDRVDAGMPLEQALASVDASHRETVAATPGGRMLSS